ncbi:glycoside hydrolase family 32 protein [Bacillus songklensis]|uniref:Sucrose-6-phosphate hydrolase n=1 Tax=Bacillus songklensis TaxID=1069116 RepID=A0ABV8B334_9BACI
MNEREKLLIDQAYKEVEQYRNTVVSDPYRLTYHIMPDVGLLNDPNGFIRFKGEYHLFYQWNPFQTAHGAKFWGHYTSTDLVHWNHEPIALAPSEWYEKNGCYSGSAVEKDGNMFLFYTGNVKDGSGNRETYQCMAISKDGVNFEKKGPVIMLPPGYTAHFRDPKVWKEHDKWYMIVGAQSENKEGKAVLFCSDNLSHWEHLGPIAGTNMNGLGEFGYMWECPDLFALNEKAVLIVSPQGLEPQGDMYHNLFQSGYFVGEIDYEKVHFKHGAFTELDRGFDFYAPQTTLDEKGRRLMFAWMGITDDQEPYHPTIQHRWIHAMTLPRELVLNGSKLYQKPVQELQNLRRNEVSHECIELTKRDVSFEKIEGQSIELKVNTMKLEGEMFDILFRDNARFVYDPVRQRASFERKRFNDNMWEARHCQLDKLEKLQVFMDTSSIEIFINDGEEVFTSRIYPNVNNSSIRFSVKGKAAFNLQKWDLRNTP